MDPNHMLVSPESRRAARIFVGVTVPLYAIALATLITRILFKLRLSVRLGFDDGFIIIGFVFATIDWAMLMAGIAWAANPSMSYTTSYMLQQSVKHGVLAVPIWGLAIGFIKISVACLMLRFQPERSWRICLHVLIATLAIVTLGCSIFAGFQCLPLAAIWDPTIVGAICVGPDAVRGVSNFFGAFCIATDIILSLFPLTFLVKLRRPFIEKLLIYMLMGVGLTASAASITKAVIIQQWVHDIDGTYVGFTISILAAVEMLIGSIAACLPCLKSTIQRLLASMGIDFQSEFPNTPGFFRSIGQDVVLGNEGSSQALQDLQDVSRKESAQTASTLWSPADTEKGTTVVGEEFLDREN